MPDLDTRASKEACRAQLHLERPFPCRRCGRECFCSEEELDAGGPAGDVFEGRLAEATVSSALSPCYSYK